MGTGMGQAVKGFEKIPCKMALEAVLRERGYKLLDEKSRERANVSIMTTAQCNYHPDMGKNRYDIKCRMGIRVQWGKKGHKHSFEGSSRASLNSAWSDGCHQVTDWAKKLLGKPIDRDKIPNKHKWKTRSVTTSFRWKKGLSPMPLLKITAFFKKAGYQAELIKSSPTQARFKLSTDQPTEQVEDLLRAYLGTKYHIRGGKNKGGLSFSLKARPKTD